MAELSCEFVSGLVATPPAVAAGSLRAGEPPLPHAVAVAATNTIRNLAAQRME
jgi:hypothetical protein